MQMKYAMFNDNLSIFNKLKILKLDYHGRLKNIESLKVYVKEKIIENSEIKEKNF